jgi:hypothetical protein
MYGRAVGGGRRAAADSRGSGRGSIAAARGTEKVRGQRVMTVFGVFPSLDSCNPLTPLFVDRSSMNDVYIAYRRRTGS